MSVDYSLFIWIDLISLFYVFPFLRDSLLCISLHNLIVKKYKLIILYYSTETFFSDGLFFRLQLLTLRFWRLYSMAICHLCLN